MLNSAHILMEILISMVSGAFAAGINCKTENKVEDAFSLELLLCLLQLLRNQIEFVRSLGTGLLQKIAH